MATARFPDFSEEKKNRKNERKCNCSDNHLSSYTKTIILLRLSEYCRIINPLEFVSGIIRQYSLRLVRRIIVMFSVNRIWFQEERYQLIKYRIVSARTGRKSRFHFVEIKCA